MLLHPFLEDSFEGRQLFALFGLVVLALTILAVRATPLLSWVAALIAVPAVALLVVLPITGHARSVVMIEQVAGLFYIAMVVTRLVGLNSARKLRD